VTATCRLCHTLVTSAADPLIDHPALRLGRAWARFNAAWGQHVRQYHVTRGPDGLTDMERATALAQGIAGLLLLEPAESTEPDFHAALSAARQQALAILGVVERPALEPEPKPPAPPQATA